MKRAISIGEDSLNVDSLILLSPVCNRGSNNKEKRELEGMTLPRDSCE